MPSLQQEAQLDDTRNHPAARAAAVELKEAKEDLAAGERSPNSFNRLAAELESKMKRTSFASLLATPHTTLASVASAPLPDDISSESPPGYLTPSHEDDYLFALDASLGTSPSAARANASRAGDKSFERDREVQVRNPVSVYNWLRKHQPQVFLQDNEPLPDKSSATTNNNNKPPAQPKPAKRPSVAAAPKLEFEILDEDGFVIGESVAAGTGSAKAKRKREDEPYRPKGGSSRSSKRKREDGGGSSRKVRKIAPTDPGS